MMFRDKKKIQIIIMFIKLTEKTNLTCKLSFSKKFNIIIVILLDLYIIYAFIFILSLYVSYLF